MREEDTERTRGKNPGNTINSESQVDPEPASVRASRNGEDRGSRRWKLHTTLVSSFFCLIHLLRGQITSVASRIKWTKPC